MEKHVNKKSPKHVISMNESGQMMISGFQGLRLNRMFCMEAEGHRYHKSGIADHSLLLCEAGRQPRNGDLVIVSEDNAPVLYRFRRNLKDYEPEQERVLSDPEQVEAIVIGSFNFYQ